MVLSEVLTGDRLDGRKRRNQNGKGDVKEEEKKIAGRENLPVNVTKTHVRERSLSIDGRKHRGIKGQFDD